MRVSVSGKQFVFPRSCACCGGYPTTILSVAGSERNRRARTKGWVWDIPYCATCKKHVGAVDYLLGVILVGVCFACLLGVFAAVLHGNWLLGVEVVVLLLLALTFLAWSAYKLIRRPASVNCCTMWRAAMYHGSNGSCHTFDFKSGLYAADFVRANPHKLVNVSVQVASILRNTGFGKHQVPRRLIRDR